MTTETEEKILAKNLADYEVKEAFEHLDFARTYTNPIGEMSFLKDDFNLRHGQAAKLMSAWTNTFTGSKEDDLWDRVYAGMKLINGKS